MKDWIYPIVSLIEQLSWEKPCYSPQTDQGIYQQIMPMLTIHIYALIHNKLNKNPSLRLEASIMEQTEGSAVAFSLI